MHASYAESCRFLQEAGFLDAGPIPPLPNHLPKYDDPEPLGVNFFRTRVEKAKFESLTLNRTFFGRSEFLEVSFKNTDLSESNLCWNDFSNVDFTNANLERSDLRSSIFSRVLFVQTNLRRADLRRSTFEDCDFSGADLQGAIVHKRQKITMSLTEAQKGQVTWTDIEGDEPGGG